MDKKLQATLEDSQLRGRKQNKTKLEIRQVNHVRRRYPKNVPSPDERLSQQTF
jgi:hypothetical protein